MADARVQHDWAQTSSVMALLANCHRDPKKSKVFKPSDFDPTQSRKPKRVKMKDLRDFFRKGVQP